MKITPSARLAFSLRVEAAVAQRDAGQDAWFPDPVIPWSQWVSDLLDEQIISGHLHRHPISAQQSLALWADIVSEDISLGETGIASLCMQAWQRMHEYLLDLPADWDGAAVSVDAAQFGRWAKTYETKLDEMGLIDVFAWARALPDQIDAGRVTLPHEVEFNGFVLGLTPLQRAVFDSLVNAGVEVNERLFDGPAASADIVSAVDRDDEVELAAGWARQRLEAGDQRIGIVVTDLSSRIDEVDRVMKRVLLPEHLRVHRDEMLPWHIALGSPLSSFPIVSLALDVLALDDATVSIPALGSLLRSPFFSSDLDDQARAAAVDAALRDLPGSFTDIPTLLREALRINVASLAERFGAWHEMRVAGVHDRSPADWARQFMAELSELSYGSGAALTSQEFQAWRSFVEVVDELSGIGDVIGKVSRADILSLLTQFCNGRLFREKNLGSPIEIMSPKEAMGGTFDALWILGVDDSSWPAPAQPDPLLPRYLQDDFLDATAEGQHYQAETILGALRRASDCVVISHARLDGDIELRLSDFVGGNLVDGRALLNGGLPSFPTQAPLESQPDDDQAPALDDTNVKGGMKVLYDQVACPFRAFARHRLQATSVNDPHNGLDARQRGTLIHGALEFFWSSVSGSEALAKLDDAGLAELAAEAAEAAMAKLLRRNPAALPAEVVSLETERLKNRLIDWAELERQRPAFTVEAVEAKKQLDIGKLTFAVKLDRIDRIDTGLMLIDYKSGNPTPAHWTTLGDMLDPQLPAYTLALDHPPAALAFGKLKPDSLGFAGISAGVPDIPGVQEMSKCSRGLFGHHSDWSHLLKTWKVAVETIAEGFQSGKATVAPSRANTCDHCELKTLCRLRHRLEMAA